MNNSIYREISTARLNTYMARGQELRSSAILEFVRLIAALPAHVMRKLTASTDQFADLKENPSTCS